MVRRWRRKVRRMRKEVEVRSDIQNAWYERGEHVDVRRDRYVEGER